MWHENTGTAALYEGSALVLAPMEGVADYWLRQILTLVGGHDWCVTEFVRVSGRLLPPSVFYRWCPELKHGAKTTSGTPEIGRASCRERESLEGAAGVW